MNQRAGKQTAKRLHFTLCIRFVPCRIRYRFITQYAGHAQSLRKPVKAAVIFVCTVGWYLEWGDQRHYEIDSKPCACLSSKQGHQRFAATEAAEKRWKAHGHIAQYRPFSCDIGNSSTNISPMLRRLVSSQKFPTPHLKHQKLLWKNRLFLEGVKQLTNIHIMSKPSLIRMKSLRIPVSWLCLPIPSLSQFYCQTQRMLSWMTAVWASCSSGFPIIHWMFQISLRRW